MTLRATFTRLPERDALEGRWRVLEAASEASFFLGWTWTGAWLDSYGVRPELLSVADGDGREVALALVGHGRTRRMAGSQATLLLGQSGDVAADRAYVEYNGLLSLRGQEAAAAQAALAAIEKRNDWRVLMLSGVAPGSPLLGVKGRRQVRMDAAPVYQVDLEAVRAAGGDYLSLLSANTRSQIKRAMKDRGGALPQVARAARHECDVWLEEMHALNAGRHADNAWDDAGFRRFVATLVARGQDNGEVDLLRMTDEHGTVGLLVNFVYRGAALNYQSAFAAPMGNKDKPGLLAHAAAVGYYADRGLSLYSLLAGKDRYKQSLSTREETLEWWVVERFSPRLEIEAIARRLLNRPVSG
ncbi:MAG: GNAT family N-acetyltransferase [Sphingobium sp.]